MEALREKCPNTEFFGPYFPLFGLNTESYAKISVFGHFSRNASVIAFFLRRAEVYLKVCQKSKLELFLRKQLIIESCKLFSK